MHPIVRIASWFMLLVPFVLFSINITTAAENLEAQKKALDIIADFADRICTTIPLKGDDKRLELTGNAKAELNELLKKVANLGIEGAAKYQTSEWQGVLQQDLAGQLNNSRNCKLEVYKDLKGKLLGQSQSSIEKTRNNIALSINEAAENLAKRAEAAIISGPDLARILVDEYNRQLQEAKDSLPKEQSIQVLKQLEYPSHYPSAGKMVAAAARKLARVADQLIAGDMDTVQKAEDEKPKSPPPTLPQVRSEGHNHQLPKLQKTAYDFNGCWQNDDTHDKFVMKAQSNSILQQWAYDRNGKPYACGGEKFEAQVDESGHTVTTRLECPQSDYWRMEGYFEKDGVLLLERTTSRNGAQTPQQQRFTRLSRAEQCPQSGQPEKLPKKEEFEYLKEKAIDLGKEASAGTNNEQQAYAWVDRYNKLIIEAKSVIPENRYIRALKPIRARGNYRQEAGAVETAVKGLEVYLISFIPSEAFRESAMMLNKRALQKTKYQEEAFGWVEECNRLIEEVRFVFNQCAEIKALQIVRSSGNYDETSGAVVAEAKSLAAIMNRSCPKAVR